mmetsp:Transcript_37817/g.119499  ORF Transcript_37817/g.119499 Transcript_37817/m.119499 type:complete len:114 (+) Transcript_37817:881-1222(+)
MSVLEASKKNRSQGGSDADGSASVWVEGREDGRHLMVYGKADGQEEEEDVAEEYEGLRQQVASERMDAARSLRVPQSSKQLLPCRKVQARDESKRGGQNHMLLFHRSFTSSDA